ncbi:MAG: hypothetical protein F4Y18_03215 [Cenarchaeum sp. SB0663_bin_5]|nr:hypothetical protein [Cenarchaeum sp. SB0663_bin_5]MYH03747.1 hypothetical protein [Cenarchaeum sp. SB0675_bin_21]MYL11688.1 hypothetical protein [Cenarchaeum sp. SB0669_bin_11]
METFENDGFTLVLTDKSHQNSRTFGSCAIYMRGSVEPVLMPSGNQRQTVYGGATFIKHICLSLSKKAIDRSFIRYLDKLLRRFVSRPSSLTTPRIATRDAHGGT